MHDITLYDGEFSANLKELGGWAEFAYRIGYESSQYDAPDTRLVSVISVPCREVFVALVCLGAVISDAETFDGSGTLTWEQFIHLDDGTIIYFRDSRNQLVRGHLGPFDDQLNARSVRDRRNIDHFILEGKFSTAYVRFDNPVQAESDGTEAQILKFLGSLGLSVDPNWLCSIYPPISVNTVKTVFKEASSQLDLIAQGEKMALSSLLKISETGGPGSGRILLNPERNARFSATAKLAIASTRYFERIIRELSFSNLMIILEHNEYDSSVATLSRLIRDKGIALPERLEFMNSQTNGVFSMTKIMPRNRS